MPRRSAPPRKRLVQAALKLFASQGYHNTSIDDILEESGCTRGVLYYHFRSKERLGYAAIDEMLRLLAEKGAGRHLRREGHPIDRMLKMIDELPGVAKLNSGDPLTPAVLARMATVHDGFRQRWLEGSQSLIRELEAMVRKGVADGQIAGSVDPRVLTSAFVVVSEGIQFASLLSRPGDLQEEARRWFKEYLNSLRAGS
jgi:AcrR family transcriptional regulator